MNDKKLTLPTHLPPPGAGRVTSEEWWLNQLADACERLDRATGADFTIEAMKVKVHAAQCALHHFRERFKK